MSIHFVTKAAALATAVGAVAVLSGCAHPQLVEMGQTQEDVIAYLGEPQAKTPMPDGTVRFTYSVQPFGQQVWWLFIDPKRTYRRFTRTGPAGEVLQYAHAG